jgi:hypothetical protein
MPICLPRKLQVHFARQHLFIKRNYPNDQNHKNYAQEELRIVVAETYNSSRGDQNPLGKPCK